jgi:hypothetical protein
MIGLSKIDNYINSLLDHLQSIQNNDGSFDTMYLQPYYNPDKGWMKFPANAPFDAACVLIPLLKIQSSQSKLILDRGKEFILNNSLEGKLWSFPKLSDEYLLFYDTDSTALCSFVLEQLQHPVSNKKFIDQFIDKGDYRSFIVPEKYPKQLSVLTFAKLLIHSQKVKKARDYQSDLMRLNDHEFSVTCNNLLYIGESDENQQVWKSLKENFATMQVSRMYYPTLFQCFYCYARLCAYGSRKEMIPELSVLNKYTAELCSELAHENQPLYRVLLANAILFIDLQGHEELMENCMKDIDVQNYREALPFYSCNIHTDQQPGTNLPNTYFGSPAITCSLYIEFLNLYRKRFYGSYYGQD